MLQKRSCKNTVKMKEEKPQTLPKKKKVAAAKRVSAKNIAKKKREVLKKEMKKKVIEKQADKVKKVVMRAKVKPNIIKKQKAKAKVRVKEKVVKTIDVKIKDEPLSEEEIALQLINDDTNLKKLVKSEELNTKKTQNLKNSSKEENVNILEDDQKTHKLDKKQEIAQKALDNNTKKDVKKLQKPDDNAKNVTIKKSANLHKQYGLKNVQDVNQQKLQKSEGVNAKKQLKSEDVNLKKQQKLDADAKMKEEIDSKKGKQTEKKVLKAEDLLAKKLQKAEDAAAKKMQKAEDVVAKRLQKVEEAAKKMQDANSKKSQKLQKTLNVITKKMQNTKKVQRGANVKRAVKVVNARKVLKVEDINLKKSQNSEVDVKNPQKMQETKKPQNTKKAQKVEKKILKKEDPNVNKEIKSDDNTKNKEDNVDDVNVKKQVKVDEVNTKKTKVESITAKKIDAKVDTIVKKVDVIETKKLKPISDDSSKVANEGNLKKPDEKKDEIIGSKKTQSSDTTGKRIIKTEDENTKKSQQGGAVRKPIKRKLQPTGKLPLVKKRVPTKVRKRIPTDKMSRKMKLFSIWNGPKRHRVASLNAIAKVHCLYENESRSNILDQMDMIKKEPIRRSPSPVIKSEPESPPPTRTLRCVPGLRAFGKMWDYATSSSDEIDSEPERPVRQKPKPRKAKPKVVPNEEPKAKKVKSPSPSPEPEELVAVEDIKKEDDEDEDEAVKDTEKEKKPIKRRKRAEIIMDLKDMVVRKRMASLNATAILAASYSVEKRNPNKPYYDSDSETTSSEEEDYSSDDALRKKCYMDDIKKEDERKLIEVRATPNKKVAVILNQDTDVTITGVYVNSTTRSTHHEGYCSIAGMQYRISATSHTQTAATAVATETILQSASTSSAQDSTNGDSTPTKSYTPLDALSNMQPPAGGGAGGAGGGNGAGQHGVPLAHPHQHPHHHHHLPPPPPHGGELSPIPRRHGCTSAFSPPCGGSQGHHHLPPPSEHGYLPGYYQPAGPLITVPHGHSQLPPVGKSVPLSDPSPSLSPTPVQQPHQSPPPPSSTGDSSDSEVIITSVTSAKEAAAGQPQPPPPPPSQSYRFSHYPTHQTYPYGYSPQYYSAPPPGSPYSHHDMCYSPYSSHKYMFRRYLPPPSGPQYYQPGSPSEIYSQPPHNTQNSSSQQVFIQNDPSSSSRRSYEFKREQVATATSTASGTTYPPTPAGPPPIIDTYPQPPPTLVETFPPSPHFYGYGHAPPPPCYTHSPPSRPMNYINATYQTCPCPIQSCPKNVHTGPLAGDSKRSNISIAKESVPLPPVALALPLEPASATGPPSPARGSAGMPPPPSPAGATYQPPPPKQETPEPQDLKHAEKRRKARVGKAMVRNTIAGNQNTMLLMCHTPLDTVKREVESPEDTEKKIEEEILEPVEERLCEPPIITQEEPTNTNIQENTHVEEEPPQLEPEIPALKVEAEPPEPCVKTVAENVKVKNMKRTSDGSYKDLIKKTQNAIKINNGKRKLIGALKRRKLAMAKEMRKSAKMNNSANNNKKNVSILNGLLPTAVKNNVDRTIESVISRVGRTSRSQERRKEKCASAVVECGVKKSAKKVKETAKPVTKRKNSKCKEVPQQVVSRVPRRSLQLRWSNGWMWDGEPFDGKVFLNSDETIVSRKCYPAMRHEEGDIIEPRDCVLLKAGQRKNELPFVAKIAALWENPDDGEMMMSLLWYYRPEHTEQGRLPSDQPDEVFASRHKDSNSVACIEDKCFVLTFNEYCRYRKNLRRLEEGLEDTGPCIPSPDPYPRTKRQPPKSVVTSPDMVFFCRRVYDFRQKRIVKNPS